MSMAPKRSGWNAPCTALNFTLYPHRIRMPASTAAPALFDIKSASLTLEAFLLKTGILSALAQAMADRFGATPDLFDGEPVVIDLTHLASLDVTVDFPGLVALLTQYKLKPVAVRGTTRKQTEAARAAGLAEAPDSAAAPARVETVEVVREVVREVIREVPVEVEVPVAATTLIIDKPLRSGQQVYAKGGDLIVTAVVNHGAEVIADGSIHVYAPLRGKAIAGAKGNAQARIFATCMEPELLSIAGTYRTTDNPLPDSVRGKPAQIRLDGERLVFEPIS